MGAQVGPRPVTASLTGGTEANDHAAAAVPVASTALTSSKAGASPSCRPSSNHHAVLLSAGRSCSVRIVQAMLRAADQVSLPTAGQPVQIRVGIATGPVVSGGVGATKPKYSLFGDTVHAASRLESAGEAGAIHVSSVTYALLVGDTSPGPHQQSQTPGEQLLQPMDGGRWSRTAAGMQLHGGGPAVATFMWTPYA